MVQSRIPHLSRRERQIMDVLFRRGRATAAEVHADLPNAPSYSAVRATLRILEEKGQVRHEQAGLEQVGAVDPPEDPRVANARLRGEGLPALRRHPGLQQCLGGGDARREQFRGVHLADPLDVNDVWHGPHPSCSAVRLLAGVPPARGRRPHPRLGR